MSKKIPRSNDNDYSLDIVKQRQAFIEENTAAKLDHTKQFSFSPDDMSGNIENLFGVAQVPIGLAAKVRDGFRHDAHELDGSIGRQTAPGLRVFR